MKQAVSRRRFVQTSVAVGTTVILGESSEIPSPSVLSATQEHSLPPKASIFVQGTVVSHSQEYLTLQIGQIQDTILLPAFVPIWRNGFVMPERLQVGDKVAVAGIPVRDNGIQALRLWVNVPDAVLGSRW
jgi:hypothetical protein